MRLLLITLLWLLPAFARAESEPFALPHPTTGEPGVWIPPWVQKIHLDTDLALKTCNLERDALTSKVSENAAELSARSAAIADLQESVAALNTQLIAEDLRAQEAESTAKNRMIWALTTTGGVVVATLVIVLQVVL
jgi:hypothetical protein